jgi:hypothetical protein
MATEHVVGAHLLEVLIAELGKMKARADKAMGQLTADQQFHATLDPDSNSIAIIVRHLAGNMRSRWTDFLTTDGEKPSRNRDGEFEPTALTRAALLQEWEAGWSCLFAALQSLPPAAFAQKVRIAGKEMTALEAIVRAFEHYAGHVGQIVLLAKHLAGPHWQTLSVPKKR